MGISRTLLGMKISKIPELETMWEYKARVWWIIGCRRYFVSSNTTVCHQKKQQKKCIKLAALERAAHGRDGALLVGSDAAETGSTACRVEPVEMAARS